MKLGVPKKMGLVPGLVWGFIHAGTVTFWFGSYGVCYEAVIYLANSSGRQSSSCSYLSVVNGLLRTSVCCFWLWLFSRFSSFMLMRSFACEFWLI